MLFLNEIREGANNNELVQGMKPAMDIETVPTAVTN